MESKGLLFIPDISGFTRFINNVEIDHSRRIIQELLEVLINANELGLEVSEIEGDAILFYKFGESPDLKQIYKQVEKMFRSFHKHLMMYYNCRYCQCKACSSVMNLTLKVITHYGEFTGYNVKNFNKLIGKDVIVAHQLLKNDIEQHEYWLITPSLAGEKNPPPGLADRMKWNSSIKKTEHGEIAFHYTQLSYLKDKIDPDPLPDLDLHDKTKIFSFSNEYDTDLITLFHAAGDFNYRGNWLEGVKSVEVVDRHLPRVGMKCRCILDNEKDVIFSSNYSYSDERIQFSETDEKKITSITYTLEKINDNKTKLTVDFYLKKSILLQILFNLMKKKRTEEILRKSLSNLETFVKNFRRSS